MAPRTIPVPTFDLALFGATGDLAKRKILPGLFHRFLAGQIPNDAKIIGASRSAMSREEFQNLVSAALLEHSEGAAKNPEAVASFLSRLSYVSVDAKGDQGWSELASQFRENVIRAFYLSVGPSLFAPIAERLVKAGLAIPESRIVVEKPFGHDLATAQVLNRELRKCFDESQIYRIDHYLGKETVQNLMALRFANALFEPLWNCQHVDHVQITVSESLGVEGRGAYYDHSGAMRDMVQNHLMQLLCLTAMEPPSRFEPGAVRNEKLKVIRALDPVPPGDIVRGQYRAQGDEPGYGVEAGNPDSTTESFIAMKVHVSNWRWSGTPFYLRTGKKLRERLSEIAIIFREPPHWIFPKAAHPRGNTLVIRLQPDEGITLRMTIKDPGPGGMRLAEVPLDMTFVEALGDQSQSPGAYERLIMDVIRGDQTLFMRGDEVEAAWEWADPIIDGWESAHDAPLAYDAGSSGPEDALMLMHRDHRRWREIGG